MFAQSPKVEWRVARGHGRSGAYTFQMRVSARGEMGMRVMAGGTGSSRVENWVSNGPGGL